MRILVLSHEYPPVGGGGAVACREVCEAFVELGHEVEVITMHCGVLPRRAVVNGVSVWRVIALRASASRASTFEMLLFVLSALRCALNRLSVARYDVVHCHFAMPAGLIAYVVSRLHQVPYIVTLHGSDVPGFNPDRFVFLHRLLGPILRAVLESASAITAPSDYLARLAGDKVGSFPLVVIPNGIDARRFIRGQRQNRIVLLGRLVSLKGFQRVLDALTGVNAEFEVHVVGDGPMRRSLEMQAKRLTLPVFFHGWIDNGSQKFVDLVKDSAILCLPSEAENMPVSLIEAMVSGLAIITSNGSGCPEVVGDAAVLVEPHDTDAIRAALLELMGSEKRRTELSEKALIRGRNFHREIVAGRLIALMSDVCGQ